MNNYIIKQYADTLYSCLLPHDMHFEHRMPAHAIIYVRSGKLLIEDNGTTTVVKSGNYVFVRRNCSVNVTKISIGDTPYRGINISLHRNVLKNYYSRIQRKDLPTEVHPIKQPALVLQKNVPLESLFQSLATYIDNELNPSKEVLNLKVQEAVLCLLDYNRCFYPTLFDFNETWKIDLMDFMEHNFTEDMTLEGFASYTGRSLATFKRDFAKLTDTPPQKWIITHRLELAHSLLSERKAQVSDVAYRVGFKNRSHFSTAFKRQYGYAPSNVQDVKEKIKL